MENYNDELLPQNFEEIARAYSKTLKNKGFVFVRLEEEEFNLLLSEIFVLIAKMQACLKKLRHRLSAEELEEKLKNAKTGLEQRFGRSSAHAFEYVQDENCAFLTLVAIENTIVIKLMLLSVKSGELELCNQIITSISGVFAECYSTDGFKVL